MSEDQGAALKTIKATIDVNNNQKFVVLKKSKKYYKSFDGITVAVLGLSFKPGTDDVREAPSLKIVSSLIEENANVKAWDPIAVSNFSKLFPDFVTYCRTIEETVKDADLCLILTEWKEVADMDVSVFASLMRNPIVIDGRNCYCLSDVKGKGITYESVGRKTVTP